MPLIDRDGLQLNFGQFGSGDPHFVFVHGFCCDNSHFQPQVEHFGSRHSLTLVDLRGHGGSDRPESGYEIHDYADDIAWMCQELGIAQPVLIGHSLGGMIAIEIAARHPSLPTAVVALDPGPIHIRKQDRLRFDAMVADFSGPDGEAVRQSYLSSRMFASTDDQQRATTIRQSMSKMPLAIAAEILRTATAWNGVGALRLCAVPLLVVLAETGGSNDPARLLALKSDLQIGVTVGSGHFIQLDAADQVNAMIEAFLKTMPDLHGMLRM